MRHAQVKKLVMLSAIGALASLALMVLSILSPKPLLLVMAMSIGQGLGTISLALYLLAIVLDLQGGAAVYDAQAEATEEATSSGEETKPTP